nr:hypothetical protein [Kofleriaceae bacterium]
MVARAHATLHQWKEAQGELLRVVKVDRSNRRGFALLGEVLLRRNDFERAVPVLQHAQNLDPTSPAILALLKRARSGQPLDPPPPVPVAVPPRGETNFDFDEHFGAEDEFGNDKTVGPPPGYEAAIARTTGSAAAIRTPQPAPAPVPTRPAVAPTASSSSPGLPRSPGPTVPNRPPISKPMPAQPEPVPAAPAPIAARTQSKPIAAVPEPPPAPRAPISKPMPAAAPPPLAPPPPTFDEDSGTEPPLRRGPASSRGAAASQPGPLSAQLEAVVPPDVGNEVVRGDPTLPSAPPEHRPAPAPRKPPPAARPRPRVDAAAQTLFDAPDAPASDHYLNDILIANTTVREPDESAFEAGPDKRWGRSMRVVFGVLFGLLVVGAAGGGTLYWYTEKLNHEAVEELHKEAKAAIVNGDYAGLTTSIGKLAEALDKDKTNPTTLAYAAETAGLDALLYGAPATAADQALTKVASDLEPGDDGWRELVIGRAAVELSRLGVVAPGRPASEVARIANSTLLETTNKLDEFLKSAPNDKWAKWLRARALLAAGKRKDATAALDDASKGEDGLVVAMIDRAALYADAGALDDALALYDKALKRSPNHPLAVLGKALARAEAGVDSNAVIDDIAMTIGNKSMGSRVSSYRQLAIGLADLTAEDYAKATEALKGAVSGKALTDENLCSSGPAEPRFWAAVAWSAYARGDLPGAAHARNCVAWYGKDRAEDDPAVQVVDAALAQASGHPDKVLTIAGALDGTRARLLRAYADLDLGKVKDAVTETGELVKRTTPADGDASKANLEVRIVDAEARMVNATDKDRDAIASELDTLATKSHTKLGKHALGMAYLAVNDAKDAQPALEDAVKDVSEQTPNPLAYRSHIALADLYIAAANDLVKDPDAASKKLADAQSELEAALKLDSAYDPAFATGARIALRRGDPAKALQLLAPLVNEHEDKIKDGATDSDPGADAVMLAYAEALVSRDNASDDEKKAATDILRGLKDRFRPATEVGRVANLIDTKLPAELGVPVPPDAPGPPGSKPDPNLKKSGHH